MLCLLVLAALFPSTHVQSVALSTKKDNSISQPDDQYVEAAMTGVNPVTLNVMEDSDSWTRGQIFEPYSESVYQPMTGASFLNDFVSVMELSRCVPHMRIDVVRSYDKFRCFAASSFSFATDGDSTATQETGEFSFKANAGYGNANSPKVTALKNFFNLTTGEAVFVTAECITHLVSIAPFHQPVYTKSFFDALDDLNRAASSSADNIKIAFGDFIKTFGTHFSRMTLMGSKVIFGKFFVRRSSSFMDELARRRCAMDSAYVNLRNSTALRLFPTVVPQRCGSEDQVQWLSLNGPMPERSLADWDSAARKSPKPIRLVLEKISTLIEERYFDEEPFMTKFKDSLTVDATALLRHFDEQLAVFGRDAIKRYHIVRENLESKGSS